ncbi:MAG: hypothetical protein LBB73_08995 [Dysgonamonadaceae bacterium]|jgi:hypothetical protein|nr:hypothetical protein [Dysgonamonadaceae bacterium]
MFDEATGEYVPVMLTIFEYNDGHGNKIYTVEAVNIEAKEKSAGLMTDGKNNPQVPIADLTNHESKKDALNDFNAKIQQLIETAKHAEKRGKNESS